MPKELYVDDEVISLYIKACGEVNLDNYDKKLIKALDTSYATNNTNVLNEIMNQNINPKSITQYMEQEKILITDALAKEYLYLFLTINFGKYDLKIAYGISNENYMEVSGFEHELLEFIISIEDEHFQFDRIEFPYIQKIHPLHHIIPNDKINQLQILLNNDYKYVTRYKSMIDVTDNNNLKVLAEILSGNTNTSKKVEDLYKKYPNVKPNTSHLLMIIKLNNKKQFASLKQIINAYAKLGIRPNKNLLTCAFTLKTYSQRKKHNNYKTIIQVVNLNQE